MAPEHARGADIDSRSDLFAAGIVLWELCAGRRMYRGTDAEMMQMALAGDVPDLPARDLPEHARLQSILSRALCVDPAARFQSAAEMLDAIDHYALSTGFMASELRFGAFLTANFAEEIVALRRERERAAEQAQRVDAPDPQALQPRRSEIRDVSSPGTDDSTGDEAASARPLWIAVAITAVLAAVVWFASQSPGLQ